MSTQEIALIGQIGTTLAAIIQNQENAAKQSDTLIKDVETLILQHPSLEPQLTALLNQAKAISTTLDTQTAKELAEVIKAGPSIPTTPVAPAITTEPASQSIAVGGTATFSVEASGDAPLAFQWRKNGTNIDGATEASYTTPVLVIEDSGTTFDVVVSNAAGEVTSDDAVLTVTAAQ